MVTVSHLVSVQPTYGWGWTDGQDGIETPPPFQANLSRNEDELTGQVIGAGHPYEGARLILSRRHQDWDGCVNVEIHAPDRATVYGYAKIPIECLS